MINRYRLQEALELLNTIFFIDKRFLFVIVAPHYKLSGRNSVVECHLAKVDVDGSNPFARSIFLSERRHSQVAKAAVCKTVIPRFKSGCRLQIPKGAAIFGLPPFFMVFLRYDPGPSGRGNHLSEPLRYR